MSEPEYRRIQQGAPGLCGVTGIVLTTRDDGTVEARMGVAIFGHTNLSEEEMRKCDFNPFHPEFHDNFCSGIGATDNEAIEALRKDVDEMHQSLWY